MRWDDPGGPAFLSVPLTFFGMTLSATLCITVACGMEMIATTADEGE